MTKFDQLRQTLEELERLVSEPRPVNGVHLVVRVYDALKLLDDIKTEETIRIAHHEAEWDVADALFCEAIRSGACDAKLDRNAESGWMARVLASLEEPGDEK